ncbi:hypothetical protein DAQ1742_03541 [Dickeya aquatica]|uniref:Uncharacterized protein n=1 Tax=Dickeya aquatica TaxID=1401087 RepID=A0A375AEM5_9GAMM|nr:hypothetical protein DAQ1742_03541 [Dickeya aquatica]
MNSALHDVFPSVRYGAIPARFFAAGSHDAWKNAQGLEPLHSLSVGPECNVTYLSSVL